MKRARPLIPVAFALTIGLSGAVAATPTAAPTPGAQDGVPRKLDDIPDSVNPIDYTSNDGQFHTTFPTGCAKLRTRMNTAEDGSADVEVRVVIVTCDRAQVTNEGCLVHARLGAARGLTGKAAADVVLAEVTKTLATYSVNPVRQTPVRRDFGEQGIVEGLDIQARPAGGAGDVWVRGLLRGEDVYILLAWKAAGGLFEDAEYGVFFEAFRPWGK